MGKLLEPEGGRPALSVDIVGGEVVIQFDKPCQWLGFTPRNALALAEALALKAMQADPGPASKIILPHKH